MIGFILLVIVFFTVRYIVKQKKRISLLEKGRNGKDFILYDERMKAKERKMIANNGIVYQRELETQKNYQKLKNDYKKKQDELDRYLEERKKQTAISENQFNYKFNQQENKYKMQAFSLEKTQKEELAKYRAKFIDENNDLIQELGLKLAREKAKERLTEMERKYTTIINDMELDYKRQLLNLEQRFAQNQQQEIERLATLKAKAYLQDNFPLQ